MGMHRAINLVLMLATLASAVALYAVKNDTRRLETRVPPRSGRSSVRGATSPC